MGSGHSRGQQQAASTRQTVRPLSAAFSHVATSAAGERAGALTPLLLTTLLGITTASPRGATRSK
jgi:hypothetical protein